MVDFEFDDDKSKANLKKHGIDFQTAQELWHLIFWKSRRSPVMSIGSLL